MSFWNKKILARLSEIFARKYEETHLDSDWFVFLKQLGCEIVPSETVQDVCDLVNLREDLDQYVVIGFENDAELILIPKDIAAVVVTLGEIPEKV